MCRGVACRDAAVHREVASSSLARHTSWTTKGRSIAHVWSLRLRYVSSFTRRSENNLQNTQIEWHGLNGVIRMVKIRLRTMRRVSVHFSVRSVATVPPAQYSESQIRSAYHRPRNTRTTTVGPCAFFASEKTGGPMLRRHCANSPLVHSSP